MLHTARCARFTSSSLWFLMPRTKSWRFLSNIRSMLPLTIFKAMSVRDLYRFCPAGPGALQRSRGYRPTRWIVSHPTGYRACRVRCSFAEPGQMKLLRPNGASGAEQRRWQWMSVGNGWQNGVWSQLTGVLCETPMWESEELKVQEPQLTAACMLTYIQGGNWLILSWNVHSWLHTREQ